ncbi:hypothetical protein B296_00032211 [Ensete ventricosum]|uniref:Uncharacterized protein n=1 Tax=Ensete ventricosum TaxID=4639 RepID=A0A427AEH9_ENSVE|nr:hypothetical protein B296_00032211 [Ensete ventricosum]
MAAKSEGEDMGDGGFEGDVAGGDEGEVSVKEREVSVNGLSMKTAEVEAKLDDGNIEEAESSLREGLSLNYERIQPSVPEKPNSRRGRSRGDSIHMVSQRAASLVLEAIYLKSMSLRKLGKATELWKQSGSYHEALASYRQALLSQWNLDDESCARIQKRFAAFLLYSGIEAGPPNLASQVDGTFVPKNNLEEAILLLMVVLRKWHLGKIQWDPSVMEHLSFALSVCSQTSVLARHFEEAMPGIYPRCDRWYSLALCYSAAGQNHSALNLLRQALKKDESPDDIMALLLAAKVCSEDRLLSAEGVEYARRAIANAQAADEHLKSVGLHYLGNCLGKQAKFASSDNERSNLRIEALKSLEEAVALERHNPDILFDLGLEYAEQHNTNAALRCAKEFIDATGGSVLKGWRLLSLILSAQQRFTEAEIVTDAALDETAKWEQGPLLRIKAKLKVAQTLPMDAIEAYRFLLALVQAQRKSESVEDDNFNEFEVWQGLANLYSGLSHWKDAEICLEKAGALKPFSSSILHTEGSMLEAHGQMQEALATFGNALSLELDDVPSKVSIGALLSKKGSKSLPVARSFLSDALRLEPANRLAWYYLGIIHRDEGRIADAADCFQAASLLEESDPIESFTSLS